MDKFPVSAELIDGYSYDFFIPKVSIDIDDETVQFLKSVGREFERVYVVRKDQDGIHVMGYDHRFCVEATKDNTGNVTKNKDVCYAWSFCDEFLNFFTARKLGHYKDMKKRNEEFFRHTNLYIDENKKEAQEKTKNIKIYQGPLDEVEKELGKKLEIINTEGPQTFLHTDSVELMVAEAYVLGADAIVHYQPGSAIGTPVKFKK